jgi:hypothetical protein
MQINIVSSLGPEAESSGKGFQPGFCFPVGNVAISNYGYNVVAWRAVDVTTDIRVVKMGEKEPGLSTTFTLVPASSTGVGGGLNMAMYEPRKNW